MKIGILSDTHDLLRPEVTEKLQGCEYILHGGDISSRKILDTLEQIAPVKAVRGNNDKEWAESLPSILDFTLAGLRICMAHKKKDLPPDLGDFDLAIYGHSHQYAETWTEPTGKKRTLLLNPGSCGPRRFIQPITMAVLTAEKDQWTVERIEISHPAKENVHKARQADMRQLIETVIRESRKGKSPQEIAVKHSIESALAEQIVRLYVTHPGVSTDGIMTKMGL